MKDVTVLIGGRAGDGINSAGLVIAHLLSRLGYYAYMYFDYPSLIKGGHNFAIVRGADTPIGTHRNGADYVIALTKETLTRHAHRISAETVVIRDSRNVKEPGRGVPVDEILSRHNAPSIMGNSALIGAFARAAAIPWDTLAETFSVHQKKALELNLAVAREAFEHELPQREITRATAPVSPLVSGNEALALGLVKGGLDFYCAYPMTPSSNILHVLAEQADTFGVTVVHPENEVAVMLMALGAACAGKRSATGTSGGGFCLMTEGLSFAGMAEIPVVIVMGQRTGPSTGLPTYTAQSDLHFVLHAGQGEFPRVVIAPGDAYEAYTWSAAALDIAWSWQVPVILLADKTLCEGIYPLDLSLCRRVSVGDPPAPGQSGPYRRYLDVPSGVSLLKHPPAPGVTVKVNSYTHDEGGITTEDPVMTTLIADKRKRKGENLAGMVFSLPGIIESAGDHRSKTALLCFGSTAGVCREASALLGLRMVRPVVLHPFPSAQLQSALAGAEKLIVVEENQEGQLASLLQGHLSRSCHPIRRYDGRPFAIDELVACLKEVT